MRLYAKISKTLETVCSELDSERSVGNAAMP